MVDYFCVPHDAFKYCCRFKVLQISSIIDEFDLHGLIGIGSRIPDHAILMTQLTVSDLISERTDDPVNSLPCANTRFKLRQIPSDFMSSEIASRALQEFIRSIELCRETQNEIDTVYSTFLTLYYKKWKLLFQNTAQLK